MNTQRLFDRAENRIRWIQGTIRVLEDWLYVATEVEQLLLIERVNIFSLVSYSTAGWVEQMEHHVRHSRLTRTGLTYNSQSGATLHIEGHVVYGLKHFLASWNLKLTHQIFYRNNSVVYVFWMPCCSLLFVYLCTLNSRFHTLGSQRWSSRYQTLGVWMLRMLENFQTWTRLYNLSLIHNHNMLSAFCSQTQIVGNKKYCSSERIGQIM